MPNLFSWLFACCSSNDGAEAQSPATTRPAANSPASAPAKLDRPPAAGPAAPAAHAPTPGAQERPVPGDEPVRSIPMEFVNPEAEVPEEVAMKGRRQSTGTLLNPGPGLPPTVDHARQSEDSPRPASFHGSQISAHSGFASLPDAATDAGDSVPQSPTGLSMNQRFHTLLGKQPPDMAGRKCLVLDLDETLVHSSFKALDYADFIIRVEIEDVVHDVYVVKRPGIDEFLTAVSQLFEVVVFTASVAKYGDPLLDRLDPQHRVHHRLFRESCYNYNGNYIKDLAQLGRPLEDVIIIDNSPGSYALQPNNAVPVSSWFSDMHDNELLDMLPLLEDLAGPKVPDVSVVLQASW